MSHHITCTPTGVHPGYKRYPDRIDRPKIKAWRCELTALSQVYNLYFLACNDTIHVYQPSFPDQNLPSEPQLILDLPVSPQTGSGIDPQDPHSVTRILVDYLGCDEILLVACDDGDVVGYRIDEIQRFLDERMSTKESDSKSLPEDGTVKCFLHRNVGASAWGLAVHREARIIAISANTHKITVIEFALSEPPLRCRECPSDSVALQNIEPLDRYTRKEDRAFDLLGETNIPAVSFNNTGDDPSGHWLFSCSIDGATTAWDLHVPILPYAVFRFGFCANAYAPSNAPRLCICVDSGNVPHGVWGALPLDTRSAREISVQERDSLRPHNDEPCFRTICPPSKRFTKGRPKRTVFEQFPRLCLPDDAEDDDVMVLDDVSEASSSTSEDIGSQEEGSRRDATVSLDGTSGGTSAEKNITHTHGASYSSSSLSSDSSPGTGGPFQGASDQAHMQPQGNSASHEVSGHSTSQSLAGPPLNQTEAAEEDELLEDDTDESDSNESDMDSENDSPYFPTELAGYRLAKRAYREVSTRAGLPDRPLTTPIRPCLVLTKEEIYLIQRPCPSFRFHPPDTILTMRRPLDPDNSNACLAPYDRLCYYTQIPDLGLFIVASPVGRAAVFALTYTKEPSTSEVDYSFSLEYILPFAPGNETELVNVPNARLLGIAVAPVQGMADVQRLQSRKWRLLMYYTDHTVLSFELVRRGQGDISDVRELVV